ncbi:MAG: hypothetical protein JWN30_233 [Bacilli bacterium]|nr:hypothetical protein [Bacilli bacterium]
MPPRNGTQARTSSPSLTTWLVVFLIIFLLVMVLVFSQYRKLISSGPGGLQRLLTGNEQVSSESSSSPFAQQVVPYGHPSFPQSQWMQRPKPAPRNLTPNPMEHQGTLKPIQGYGFTLADQIMVRA